jgi:PIN domain nuclease of toxin-antitoxin system
VILLLDTQVLLWWLANDRELRPPIREAIADPMDDVLVSAASVWEIAIKRRLGKLVAPPDVADLLEGQGMTGLPITTVDAETAGALPPHHRDPFDRMLVAQARRVGAVIVTGDPAFRAYGVDVLPA